MSSAETPAQALWTTPPAADEADRLRLGKPRVSIVTPSFNQAAYLEQAIESVVGQDYPDLEYIVIDGGSDDESLDILRRWQSHFAYWRSARDDGQVDALNHGMAWATGDIIAWLNSDDFYYPGAIAAAVAAFQEDSNLGFVYGRGMRVDACGQPIAEFESARPFNLEALTHGIDYVLQPTVFMRRSALYDAGPLDRTLEYAFDRDLWIRLGQRAPARMLDAVMAASREHAATKTAQGGFRRAEEIRRLALRHTGRELSIGYLSYLMHTVLDALPASTLPDQPRLQAAIGQVLSVCAPLLRRAQLRAVDGEIPERDDVPPYVDGWAGPLVRVRRPAPDDATFLCLTGTHDQTIADIAGPLTLWARVDGQSLGAVVVSEHGPFTVAWPVPAGLRSRGASGADRLRQVEVATGVAPVIAHFRPTPDDRPLAYRVTDLRFVGHLPAGVELASPAIDRATELIAARMTVGGSGDTPPFSDGWAGPSLRLSRALSPDAAYLCLTGFHQQDVAVVTGPLVVRVAIDECSLGIGVAAEVGPFALCWRLPDPVRTRRAGGVCRISVTTAMSFVPARFMTSDDWRPLAFKFERLEIVAAPPPGAVLMADGLHTAADALDWMRRPVEPQVFRLDD